MNPNCYICAIRPTLYITLLTTTFINFGCPHARVNPCSKSYMSSSTKLKIGSTLLGVALVSVAMFKTPNLFTTGGLLKSMRASFLFSDCLCVLAIIVVHRKNWDRRFSELKTRLRIAMFIERFKIIDFEYKLLYILQFVAFFIANILYLMSCLVYYKTTGHVEESVEVIVLGWCLYLLTLTYIVQILVEYLCYRIFFKHTFAQIKTEVKCRLNNKINLFLINTGKNNMITSKFITNLRRLKYIYSVTVSSYTRTFYSYNIIMLMMVMCQTIMTIFGIFIIVIQVMKHVLQNEVVLLGRYAGAHIFMFTLYWTIHQIKNMNAGVVSFLYTVPLFKLNKDEANEVENFIRFISWHKPSGSVCSIVNIDLSLAGNIVAYVVTQCLVMSQIYLTFIDPTGSKLSTSSNYTGGY